MKKQEFIAKTCRAAELLGNPLRMSIFLRILEQGCDCNIEEQEGLTGNCVSGIVRDLGVPQSTVSTYIKELVQGELITCSKRGKYLYCQPNRAMLVHLRSFFESALKQIRLPLPSEGKS
jgi:DNA-binding transcriptional ArsR family regulator